MVVVISGARLPTEHSLFHAHVPLWATEVLLSQDCACGTVYRLLSKTYHQLRTVRQHLKTHLYTAYKSQRIVTLDYCALYANTLTYLITYFTPRIGCTLLQATDGCDASVDEDSSWHIGEMRPRGYSAPAKHPSRASSTNHNGCQLRLPETETPTLRSPLPIPVSHALRKVQPSNEALLTIRS